MSAEKTILVIDDDPMIRKMVGRMLKIKKYNVVEAEGGQEAIDMVPSLNNVHYIILDLSMPGMSGEETLVKLRELKPDWRVILSSGYGSSLDREKFMSLGVSKFLNKPFDMQELFKTVEE